MKQGLGGGLGPPNQLNFFFLFKKFKPNDGLLDDCCCCGCGGGGGSNGEEGRLDPDEFIGGVELLDLDDNVLRFDGAASLPIIFDELSGISNFYDPSLKKKKKGEC